MLMVLGLLYQDFRTAFRACWRSKALIFGFLLTALEWYDYALFGYFAALIGRQFFPSSDPLTSLLSSFAVFASGFAMRPLGAWIFGSIGDRIGPRKAMLGSLVLMAVPTTLLGFLPAYHELGIYASISLVLIRLCQGLAVGGNYGGSFIVAVESAPAERQGLSGSLTMFGTLGGLFMGSGVAALLSGLLSLEDLEAWGWRVPFLLASASAYMGYRLRHHVPERELEDADHTAVHTTPLKKIWGGYKRQLLRAMGVILLDGVGVYILFVFMTSYASVFLKIPAGHALLSNTLAMALLVVLIPFFGWLGDRTSAYRVLQGVSLFLMALALPLFWALTTWPCMITLVLVQILFAVLIGAAYGALPVVVVRAFPKGMRYTACGLAFNVSVAIFGGTAPWVVTQLMRLSGWLLVPALMLVSVGVISFIAVLGLKASARRIYS